jgi:RHS repeat-associated protein
VDNLPAGTVTSATYDARGNVTSSTDWSTLAVRNGTTYHATTRYAYEDRDLPDFPTRITLPEGEVTRTGYHPDGNRAWQQPGDDASRRVTFGYNTAGLASTVTQPGASTPTRFDYDAFGNFNRVTTPLAIETRYVADQFGRDTLVDAPVDATRRLKTVTRYDVMGFDTLSISDGDPNEGDLHVRTVRDREGRPLEVERWSTVNSSGAGHVKRRWEYDAAGRVAVEYDESGMPLGHAYDAAGNDTLTTGRRAQRIRTRYDVLGRALERQLPRMEYDQVVRARLGQYQSTGIGQDIFPHPDFEGNSPIYVIPGDTERFAYDPVTGAMTEADNRDAQVRRTYYPNGTLKSETSHIRTWAGDDFATHKYVLEYAYDLNGRRTRMTLPENLAPSQAERHQDYQYDPVSGGVATVRSAMGLEYGFTYNREGAAESIRYPGNRVESFRYDPDGRLEFRRMVSGNGELLSDVQIRSNANGSTAFASEAGSLRVVANEAEYRYRYTQLGRLRHAETKRNGSGGLGPKNIEEYEWDALGNRWQSHISGNAGAQTVPTVSRFRDGTNQVDESGAPPGVSDTKSDQNNSYYDGAGNLHWFLGTTLTERSDAVRVESRVTRSYYTSGEKLYAAETRRCISDISTVDQTPSEPPHCLADSQLSNETSGSFEWYRYDALGRRVLVRTRRDPWCNSERCNSTITRFIWDGDQILSEIRGDGGANYSESYSQTGPQYGRVVYTHGPKLDRPLDIMHMDGRVAGRAGAILPIATWRGSFAQATDPQGNVLCPAPGSSAEPCIVAFPGSYSSSFYDAGMPVERVGWFGSLSEGNVDGSGTIYMRNRYYNPQTGAFTQQDPIGLAGGLNTYGFANGDPVTYSDPYGLCPIPLSSCPPGYFARAGRMVGGLAGAVVGGIGGGGGGATACAPTVVGSVPCGVAGAAAGGAVGLRRGAVMGRMVGMVLDEVAAMGRSHTATVEDMGGRYGQVRVDWEEPTSGGDPGNVHVQNKNGRVDIGKVYITSMDDLQRLPEAIRNNPRIQRGVQRALEQLDKQR